MDAETLLKRAAQRCSKHLPGRGFCHDCVMDELQEMLLAENPELSRGDAHDLAWEWVARADEAEL